MIWEVFRQDRKGQPFEHAGSLDAPDAEFAEAWAREQYGRRGESVALWLVPRDEICVVDDWADEFELKYRRVDGYSIKARLAEARERAADSRAMRGSREGPQAIRSAARIVPGCPARLCRSAP